MGISKLFYEKLYINNFNLEVFYDVLLTLVFSFLFCLLIHYIFCKIIRRVKRKENFLLYSFLVALPRTLYFLIFLSGFFYLVREIDFLKQFKLLSLLADNSSLILLFVLGLFFIRVVEKIIHYIGDADYFPNIDKFIVSIISKFVRIILILSFTLILLDNLGVKVTGILAFAGIGAASIGFASQNLVSNFFGAFAIFLDRPFKMGDYIITQDKTIEGVVEDISWRMTRLVAPDGNNLYVPNSYFLSTGVKNESQTNGRRINKTIGIRYQDIKHVKDIVESVEKLVSDWPDVDHAKNIYIALVDFSAFSIDIDISFFIAKDDYREFIKSQQDFLLRLIDIIHSFGADIALPNTTIDLANDKINLSPRKSN